MLHPEPHLRDGRRLFQTEECSRVPSTPSINHRVAHTHSHHPSRLAPVHPGFRCHEYFGIFANTLRHFDVRNAHDTTAQRLLYIVCQFPLLEDLSIVSPDEAVVHPGYPVSTITRSPPFRGKLLLAQMYPGALSEGLATLPGGLHFRSLELIWCRCPGIQAVLTASSGTVASVSYLWPVRDSGYSESNPSISRILLLDCLGP